MAHDYMVHTPDGSIYMVVTDDAGHVIGASIALSDTEALAHDPSDIEWDSLDEGARTDFEDEGWRPWEGRRKEAELRAFERRSVGRPRIHNEPRRKMTMTLPEALIDAIPGEVTAFVEAAIREKLERR